MLRNYRTSPRTTERWPRYAGSLSTSSAANWWQCSAPMARARPPRCASCWGSRRRRPDRRLSSATPRAASKPNCAAAPCCKWRASRRPFACASTSNCFRATTRSRSSLRKPSPPPDWAGWSSASSANSRAGRNSACCSRWPSAATPTCCSSTSPPWAWMWKRAAAYGNTSADSWHGAAACCSPRTTWRKPTRWPTGSPSSMADASSPKARQRKSSGWARRPQVPARVAARVPATAAWKTRSSPWSATMETPSKRCCNDARLLAGGADRVAEIRPHEKLRHLHHFFPADVLLFLRAGDAATFAWQLDGALPAGQLRRVRHHGLDAVRLRRGHRGGARARLDGGEARQPHAYGRVLFRQRRGGHGVRGHRDPAAVRLRRGVRARAHGAGAMAADVRRAGGGRAAVLRAGPHHRQPGRPQLGARHGQHDLPADGLLRRVVDALRLSAQGDPAGGAAIALLPPGADRAGHPEGAGEAADPRACRSTGGLGSDLPGNGVGGALARTREDVWLESAHETAAQE